MNLKWWPDWTGVTAVIVASGPSAATVPLELARDRARIIAVNESWRLAPWADALYAADGAWWRARNGVPEFLGLRVTQDARAATEFGLRRVTVLASDDRMSFEAGVIGSGGNSGFQALNLAVQWGAKRIVLVGFDVRLDAGVHWHGRHELGMNNPRSTLIGRWRRALDGAARALAEHGVEVVNASPVSSLANYRKITLEQAIENEIGARALPTT